MMKKKLKIDDFYKMEITKKTAIQIKAGLGSTKDSGPKDPPPPSGNGTPSGPINPTYSNNIIVP